MNLFKYNHGDPSLIQDWYKNKTKRENPLEIYKVRQCPYSESNRTATGIKDWKTGMGPSHQRTSVRSSPTCRETTKNEYLHTRKDKEQFVED